MVDASIGTISGDPLLCILARLDLCSLSCAAAVDGTFLRATRSVRGSRDWISRHRDEVNLQHWAKGRYSACKIRNPPPDVISMNEAHGKTIMSMGHGLTSVDLQGQWLASGGCDGVAKLWRADRLGTCEPAFSLLHADSVSCVATNTRIGKVATASMDGCLRLWSLHDGELASEVSAHDGDVLSLLWVSGTELLSGGLDRMLKHWNVLNPADLQCTQAICDDLVTSTIAFDAYLGLIACPFTSAHRATIGLLSADRLEITLRCHGSTRPILAVAIGGGFAAGGGFGGEILVWDAVTGIHLSSLATSVPCTYALAIHGYTLISGSCNETCVRVWSLRSGRVVTRLHRPTGGQGSFCTLSFDGQRIVGGDNCSPRPTLWQTSAQWTG